MWKEYFSHTKSERRATIVLIVLILAGAITLFFLNDNPYESTDQIAESQFRNDVKRFEASEKHTFKKWPNHSNYPKYQPITTSLFSFDPNSADSITFLRLGLKPFMAKAILKYRNKGGKYRKPEDFSKVPFIDPQLLSKLLPYIRINEKYIAKHDTFPTKMPPFVKQEKYAEGTVVDLETADTTELKKIPGIASGIAKAIVSYRSRLGGFYSIHQLKELKNINEEQYTKISKFLKISEPRITKLAVNKVGMERLMAHPYLNFYQAKALFELRKKKGKITRLEEFSLYDEFTEKDFERLKYYLDFS
ncbi:MAG: helix-hairpin-helix domain-containing protein [Bacteroidales bacterium]